MSHAFSGTTKLLKYPYDPKKFRFNAISIKVSRGYFYFTVELEPIMLKFI